ncbi:MAG: ABC transporter ATP-binding protein [Candidatus Thermoplasmatota archaeon]|nr:ABC transporter ATP-binding protein [Candidatus Thermoplasmatota archaeon]
MSAETVTKNHEGPVIEAVGLTKYYGKSRGIENLDLQVEAGEIYGFLGPNGAGKTTAIRVLLNLIHKTGGQAKVYGLDVEKDSVAVRSKVGYLPGDLGIYKHLTGSEYLDYFQRLRGEKGIGRREELAQRFKANLQSKIKDLSKGNRQKIGLIQAFDHDPPLIILDEPTSGLDPLMQQEFYKLIKEEKARGKTIFMSSHIMSEVEHVCDRVGVIKDGRMLMVESIPSLKEKMGKVIAVRFANEIKPEVFNISGTTEINMVGRTLKMRMSGNLDQMIKLLSAHRIEDISITSYSLEDFFLEYYSDKPRPDEPKDEAMEVEEVKE